MLPAVSANSGRGCKQHKWHNLCVAQALLVCDTEVAIRSLRKARVGGQDPETEPEGSRSIGSLVRGGPFPTVCPTEVIDSFTS